MKKKMIITIVLIIAVVFYSAYMVDMNRMKNNKPVVFSSWGYDYAPSEIGQNDYLSENEEYEHSFVGKVVEETTRYMIVEPVKDKADGNMGDRVKVEYGTEHCDYLFGIGRKVVIYFDGKSEETADGMKLIKSDDISTEGFREFELEVVSSGEKRKRLVLKGDDIQDFTSFGHLGDTNLYYYGLDNVMITIKGFTMPLDVALKNGRITLDGIVADCNQDVSDGVIPELVYKDGGSQVYKYPEYNIIKYHTVDGNRDVYIGSADMDIQIANK